VSAPALAHDIPNDVTSQAWLKPEGSRLRLVVHVPLSAMRGWHWMIERADRLRQVRVEWPPAPALPSLLGAAALIGLIGGVIWLMRGAFSGQIGPPSRLLEQHTRLGETSER